MLKLDCGYKFDTEGLMSATKSASEFAEKQTEHFEFGGRRGQ